MDTIKRTLYATKRQGNFVGTILLPKGSECGQKMKYFDAVEWGVPVEYKEKKKVIDKDAFSKILAKHLVDGKDLVVEIAHVFAVGFKANDHHPRLALVRL